LANVFRACEYTTPFQECFWSCSKKSQHVVYRVENKSLRNTQWILSGFKTISLCLLWSNILMVDIPLIKSPNAITMQWGTSYSFQDLTLCVFWIITDIFNFVKHQSVWAWHFVKDASGARDVSITSIWIFVVSICLLITKPYI